MFNQIRKIDDIAIEIEQVKNLLGVLIECRDMPREYQASIVHISFDTLSKGAKELSNVSASLTRVNKTK